MKKKQSKYESETIVRFLPYELFSGKVIPIYVIPENGSSPKSIEVKQIFITEFPRDLAFPKFVIYFVNEDKTIEETLQHDTIEEAMDDVKLLLNVGRSEWKSCEITLESSDSSLIDVDFGDESSTTG